MGPFQWTLLEQYFPTGGAVYYAVYCCFYVWFDLSGWNPKVWPFKWKLLGQYFPVVLFVMLYKVILTFESVDEILKCDHSNESYWAVLSCGAVYYAVQGDSNFWVCGWNPKVWPFKRKRLNSTFQRCCSQCCITWLNRVCLTHVWPFKWKLLNRTFS